MIDPHMTPELALNGLRLLPEGYKVFRDRFRDKSTPDRVEEILVEAEKTPAKAAEIQQRLTMALEPSDAAIITGDLELLTLFAHPIPNLDAFDYWSQLTKLVDGLHAYAIKNRLFELRGVEDLRLEEVLVLPRTSKCLLPEKRVVDLAVSPSPWQRVKDVGATALLQRNGTGFPIALLVRVRLNHYDEMGGPPTVTPTYGYFSVACGRKPHWLRFGRQESSHYFVESQEYMLNAVDLISIMEALRDDIRKIVAQVQADERKIAPFFQAIDAFSKEMSK